MIQPKGVVSSRMSLESGSGRRPGTEIDLHLYGRNSTRAGRTVKWRNRARVRRLYEYIEDFRTSLRSGDDINERRALSQ